MTCAIDPLGSFRHALSDPRDDDYQPRDERPRTFYTPQVQVQTPPKPCYMVGCSKESMHLGDHDLAERLETSTLCPRCGAWYDDEHACKVKQDDELSF